MIFFFFLKFFPNPAGALQQQLAMIVQGAFPGM
jgi:hypothetical protein